MTELLAAALTGFLLVGGLIVAIGAQNGFILRQGLLRANVPLIVGIAIGLDAGLMTLGTLGFGAIVGAWPALLTMLSWAGAAFLALYGLVAFRRALHPGRLDPAAAPTLSGGEAARILLAVSLLNPHVYLDTVILVGSIAGRYAPPPRLAFLGGAILASTLWFTALGFGARLLAPLFARPAAWRLLDLGIGLVMLAIAGGLVDTALRGGATSHAVDGRPYALAVAGRPI